MQDGADEIETTPDGTVLAGVEWDEAGRCIGLYKDGRVNRVLLQTKGEGLPDSAWGWGTGNDALAASGDQIFVTNAGKKLLRFRWTPGDLNSAKFEDAVGMTDKAVGLAAQRDRLAVVYPNRIELRRTKDMSVIGGFDVKDAKDAAFAEDGGLWVLAEGAARRYSDTGEDLGVSLSGLQEPTVISFDLQGRLIVADNGPRQQVLFFDVSRSPRLASSFGKKGGLLSGVPDARAATLGHDEPAPAGTELREVGGLDVASVPSDPR